MAFLAVIQRALRESRRQIIIAAGPTKLDSSAAADDEVIGLKHIWPLKVAAPGLLREMEKDFLNGDSQGGSTAEIARKFPQQGFVFPIYFYQSRAGD